MTKDEALDLALEAWQTSVYGSESHHKAMLLAMTNMAQARSAPYVASPRVQEPVAFNAGVPPLYPEMKDGETISVEYTTPPDVATPLAAQEDIQRLSALVRAQQITIDKLEAQRQWVGLTPHERMMCRSYDIDTAIDKTEAKLMEKNT